jgi:predicted nucleic acid-binding Zn ribbon protein
MEWEQEREEFRIQNEPVSIKNLLQKVIAGKKWQSRLELHQVFDLWNEIVGPDISERAQPSRIRRTVLWVDVTDSIWMQQLHLQKILLLDLINQKLDGSVISEIRFQLNVNLEKEKQETPQAQPPRPLNKKKQEAFEDILAPVTNKDVREALRNIWKKSQQAP